MTAIKPSTHGIVVEHKESEVRYAISDRNYNPDIHRKVRDLRPGETVLGYKPRRKQPLGGSEASQGAEGSPAPTQDASGTQAVSRGTSGKDTQTEGSAPADTKGK